MTCICVCKYFARLRHNAPGDRNPNTLIYKTMTKEFYRQNLVIRHLTRPCLCMTTSIIIKITCMISMWTPHWITVSCHGVEGPTSDLWVLLRNFSILWRRKKKDDKKTKAFYDWATTGIPVKIKRWRMLQNVCLVTTRLFDEGSLDTREGHK